MLVANGRTTTADQIVEEHGFICGVWKVRSNSNVWFKWTSELTMLEFMESNNLSGDTSEDAPKTKKKSMKAVKKKPAAIKTKVVGAKKSISSAHIQQSLDNKIIDVQESENSDASQKLGRTRNHVFSRVYGQMKRWNKTYKLDDKVLREAMHKCMTKIKNVH